MTIRVTCPNPSCAARADVDELSLGKRGRCKKCGQVFALARPGGDTASAGSGEASAWKRAGESASTLDLPEPFGRYRILRLLGRGGMGAVYLAHDTRLDRQVALKVPSFSAAEAPDAVTRFEREARAAATLDHPNLCPIHDVGEVDGIPYLTMPYIKGKPLSEALAPGQVVAETHAAAVALKLAQALQEAHERGIIHRDLKPSNIMVNRRRELIVMDFGLARAVEPDDRQLTRTGHVLGTALYMAPEQAAGDSTAIGPPADVYSLGVILYELLTGRRPFEGPWSLVIGLKSVKEPEPPSIHRPELSPSLDAICLKAIAREPKDRYATMSEVALDLGEFLKTRAVAERGSVPTESEPKSENLAAQAFGLDESRQGATGSGLVAPVHPEPGVASASPMGKRQRWLTYAFLAVASLLVVAVIAALFIARGPKYDLNDFRVGRGEWMIVGDELEQMSVREEWAGLRFGDPNWTDYEVTAEVMWISGQGGFALTTRTRDLNHRISIHVSFPTSPSSAFYYYTDGPHQSELEPDYAFKMVPHRWYSVRLSARGDQIVGTVLEGETEVLRMATNVNDLPRGYVAIATFGSVFRFRNIQVTDPDGGILWKGLPALGKNISKPGDGRPDFDSR